MVSFLAGIQDRRMASALAAVNYLRHILRATISAIPGVLWHRNVNIDVVDCAGATNAAVHRGDVTIKYAATPSEGLCENFLRAHVNC